MLDILVYLYESFRMAELAPDRDALEKRLFAAGFEEADINAALDWYANLTGSATHERLALAHYRHYAPEELERLNDACRSELDYLVSATCSIPSRAMGDFRPDGAGGRHRAGACALDDADRAVSRGLIEHFTHLEDMLLNHEPGRLH
jgi:Smg protein